jgi:hypothetical protein
MAATAHNKPDFISQKFQGASQELFQTLFLILTLHSNTTQFTDDQGFLSICFSDGRLENKRGH